MINVRDLPPPPLTELEDFNLDFDLANLDLNDPDDSIAEEQLGAQTSDSDVGTDEKRAVWEKMRSFIAEVGAEVPVAYDEYDVRTVFNEYIQNAFRYGGHPLNVYVAVVRVTPYGPYQVLLGVEDTNPDWEQPDETSSKEQQTHGRGVNKVVGQLAMAACPQPYEDNGGKWVWALMNPVA